MINTPIVITDYEEPVDNTRKLFLEEENQKIKGKKGFVFTNFQTEKERIKDYLSNREKEKKQDQLVMSRSLALNSNLGPQGLGNLDLVQPYMRFKPRTDLERIIDTLKSNNLAHGKAQNILNKQLKDQELGIKNPKDKEPNDTINTLGISLNPMKVSENKKPLTNLAIEKIKNQKRVDNSQAKNIRKDLYCRTHFKGATALTNQKLENDHIIESLRLNIKNKRPKKLKEDIFFPISQNNFYQQMQIKTDYNDFKLNYNPLIKSEENSYKNNNQLQKVEKIFMLAEAGVTGKNIDEEATLEMKNYSVKYGKFISKFQKAVKILDKNDKRKIFKDKKLGETDEIKKEEEKVVIDSEAINKNELNTIAIKILNKCNYFHKKNKNNLTELRSNQGSTCITKGMSIEDFEKKYNIRI